MIKELSTREVSAHPGQAGSRTRKKAARARREKSKVKAAADAGINLVEQKKRDQQAVNEIARNNRTNMNTNPSSWMRPRDPWERYS